MWRQWILDAIASLLVLEVVTILKVGLGQTARRHAPCVIPARRTTTARPVPPGLYKPAKEAQS